MADFTMYADNPLLIPEQHDTFSGPITNGEMLTIHMIETSAQQDDRDEGAVVELFWDIAGDGSDLRLIYRAHTGFGGVVLHAQGWTAARDGTPLNGDGIAKLLVRRRRIGAFSIEFEVVVRGFTR